MGKDRLSVEVDMLLDKLLLFQEQVGGKEEEKKEWDRKRAEVKQSPIF